jgi:deoxycytidylate deaminase
MLLVDLDGLNGLQTLADLASQRSNCMKRRVGAILVRENRIVSTGYVQIALWALKLSSRSTVITAPLVASKTAMKVFVFPSSP